MVKWLSTAWRLLLVLGCCMTVAGPAVASVTDLADVLTHEQEQALELKLAAFGAKHGRMITLWITPITGNEPVRQAAQRLVGRWRDNDMPVDEGALLFVATDQQLAHIVVGKGLAGALSAEAAGRIVDETIAPHMQDGQLYTALDAALDRIMEAAGSVPPPRPPPAPTVGSTSAMQTDGPLGLLILAILPPLFTAGALSFLIGRLLASTVIGVCMLSLALMLGWAWWSLLVGGIAFLVSASGLSTLFMWLLDGRRGDGFGGGDGDFGGGGASGKW